MNRIVKKRILNIKPYIPGKPIDEVKRELGLKNVVKLASNENPFGPSKKVLEAIEKEAKNLNRYPDAGCFYLRKELSKRLGVSGEQLVFGNGSDEIIVSVLRAFAGEGDEVVMARPSFLVYDIAARIVGATVKAVPLVNFFYDLDGMAKAITRKTKVIFIGNPDNPCGTYVTDKQLKAFLKKIRKDIIVFIDEAYYEYVSDKEYPDTIKLLKSHKNIIATRTFSKMYGLAGLRVGYGIATKETVDILNRIREPFNVNSLAQVAAVACLKDKSHYKKLARDVERQRQFLYKELSSMGIDFVKTSTNFILINTKSQNGPVLKKLLKRGVIVRDMSFWGLSTYIRVTIGKEKENKKFISALKGIL
jgi:histidinol-phosphate aminotransferase